MDAGSLPAVLHVCRKVRNMHVVYDENGNPVSHGHTHCEHQEHCHHHDHAEGAAPDRSQALLSYMVGHNKSHADEMREAAAGMEGRAQALVNEAADLLDAGNAKLEEALAILKGGQEE